jgi:hypothetical protein
MFKVRSRELLTDDSTRSMYTPTDGLLYLHKRITDGLLEIFTDYWYIGNRPVLAVHDERQFGVVV